MSRITSFLKNPIYSILVFLMIATPSFYFFFTEFSGLIALENVYLHAMVLGKKKEEYLKALQYSWDAILGKL